LLTPNQLKIEILQKFRAKTKIELFFGDVGFREAAEVLKVKFGLDRRRQKWHQILTKLWPNFWHFFFFVEDRTFKKNYLPSQFSK